MHKLIAPAGLPEPASLMRKTRNTAESMGEMPASGITDGIGLSKKIRGCRLDETGGQSTGVTPGRGVGDSNIWPFVFYFLNNGWNYQLEA